MDINQQMLETRISIIQEKENYTFLTGILQYKTKLYEYFKVEYGELQIGNALKELEDMYYQAEYEKQQVLELPEDFELR